MTRLVRGAWLALACCMVACGSDDGARDHTRILARGEGVENVEPLFPLRPGLLVEHTLLLAPVTMGGRRVYPYGNASAFPPIPPRYTGEPSHYVMPAEPAMWQYLSLHDGDVYVEGTPRDGLFPHAVLLVPARVRVGMKWESQLDAAGALVRVEVTHREERDTIYGHRAVWTLSITDPSRPEAFDRTFIEGRGPADWPNGSIFGYYTAARTGVVPLDDRPPRPERPRLALRRLGVLQQDRVLGALIGTSNPAADGDLVRIGMMGYTTGLPAPFRFECIGWDPAQGELVDISYDCGNPLMSIPLADGDYAELTLEDVAANAGTLTCDIGFDGTLICPRHYALRAIYEAPSGVELFAQGPGTGFVTGHLFGVRLNGDNIMNPIDHGPTFLRLGELGLGGNAIVPAVAPDGRMGVGWLGAQIGFAALDAEFHATMQHLALENPGRLSVLGRVGGRDTIRTTPDGGVDAIVFTPQGVTVEPIGQLDLPAGHFLAGAMRAGGKLFVVTHADYFDDNPNPTLLGDFAGVLTAWEATPGAPAAAVVPAPELGGITATPVDADVRVCWPPGNGAASLTGWTLGGKAPGAVIAAGPGCVLVARDWRERVDLTVEGAFAVEGPVPGIGRVAIAVGPAATSASVFGPQVAPLTGGGFAASIIYSAGGLAETSSPAMAQPMFFRADFDGFVSCASARDYGGFGWWSFGCTPTGERSGQVALVGRDTLEISNLPAGATGPSAVVVRGGGVFLGSVVLQPDGTTRALPALPAGFAPRVVLADGRTCGTFADHTYGCVDASGAVQKPSAPAEPALADMIVASDKTIYLPLSAPVRLARWDLTAMTVTDVAFEPTSPPIYAADGSAFAFVGGTFLQLTDDGLVDVRQVNEAGALDVAVDEDVFIMAMPVGALSAVARVPRVRSCDGAADCDDDLACTEDRCEAGACTNSVQAGACFIDSACRAPGPIGGDPCRVCDPARPLVFSLAVGATCDDGLACTIDQCSAQGLCESTSSCDVDGLTCTLEVCTATGCQPPVDDPNTCLIDGVCYAPGAINPDNGCYACVPGQGRDAFTNMFEAPVGWCPIYDNLGINIVDCIADGERWPGQQCNECQSDASGRAQVIVAHGSPCDDGLECTGADHCEESTCVPGHTCTP